MKKHIYKIIRLIDDIGTIVIFSSIYTKVAIRKAEKFIEEYPDFHYLDIDIKK